MFHIEPHNLLLHLCCELNNRKMRKMNLHEKPIVISSRYAWSANLVGTAYLLAARFYCTGRPSVVILKPEPPKVRCDYQPGENGLGVYQRSERRIRGSNLCNRYSIHLTLAGLKSISTDKPVEVFVILMGKALLRWYRGNALLLIWAKGEWVLKTTNQSQKLGTHTVGCLNSHRYIFTEHTSAHRNSLFTTTSQPP